jgi:hypothetical protein
MSAGRLHMELLSPTTWICCFDEIVGVTPMDLTVVPLIQSIGDFMFELALSILFSVSHILSQLYKN